MTCNDCDGAGCGECALPRRGSGAPSEAYYRSRGYQRLQLRLPRESIDRLDELAEQLTEELGREPSRGGPGVSRGEVLGALLRCAHELERGDLAASVRLQEREERARRA